VGLRYIKENKRADPVFFACKKNLFKGCNYARKINLRDATMYGKLMEGDSVICIFTRKLNYLPCDAILNNLI